MRFIFYGWEQKVFMLWAVLSLIRHLYFIGLIPFGPGQQISISMYTVRRGEKQYFMD